MRRVFRPDLPAEVAHYLDRRQQRADKEHAIGTLHVEKSWRSACQTLKIRIVRSSLKQMAGGRQRCMYCSDSAGTDIEHFWPKSTYPERMFQWMNLLMCCTGCGRDCKGSKFPLDHGQPALLDPTVEDPWKFLDFSPATGILFPLVDPQGRTGIKGEKTVEILKLDRRDEVNLSYRKSFRRIGRILTAALADPTPDPAAVVHSLTDADDHGLLGWCFRGNGTQASPMTELRQTHPDVWTACQIAFHNI